MSSFGVVTVFSHLSGRLTGILTAVNTTDKAISDDGKPLYWALVTIQRKFRETGAIPDYKVRVSFLLVETGGDQL